MSDASMEYRPLNNAALLTIDHQHRQVLGFVWKVKTGGIR